MPDGENVQPGVVNRADILGEAMKVSGDGTCDRIAKLLGDDGDNTCKGLRLQYMRLESAQVVNFKLDETWQPELSRMTSQPFDSTRLN